MLLQQQDMRAINGGHAASDVGELERLLRNVARLYLTGPGCQTLKISGLAMYGKVWHSGTVEEGFSFRWTAAQKSTKKCLSSPEAVSLGTRASKKHKQRSDADKG